VVPPFPPARCNRFSRSLDHEDMRFLDIGGETKATIGLEGMNGSLAPSNCSYSEFGFDFTIGGRSGIRCNSGAVHLVVYASTRM